MSADLPLLATVDLLVIGADSSAVAAALAAHAAGASVFLVGSRPYLGEDICADLQLWREAGEQVPEGLARRIFPDAAVPRPMAVKIACEQSLVEAGIPFVFNSHPAGVLRDAAGCIRGAVIANRNGRQAIAARQVLDCSAHALCARQAGLLQEPACTGRQLCEHVVLSTVAGAVPAGPVTAVEALPPLRGSVGDKDWQLFPLRISLEVDCGDGSISALAAAEAELQQRCWTPGLFLQSERLRIPRCAPAGALTIDPATIDPARLFVADGLACCAAAELDEAERAALDRPLARVALGTRLGAMLAARGRGQIVDAAALRPSCAEAQAVASGELRGLDEALRPGARGAQRLPFDPRLVPHLGDYDVIVVGGGTGGAPAAIGAARAGARVALIEALPGLGGVGTLGQIACYYHGNRVGFCSEIDAGVASLEVEERYQAAKGQWTPAAKASWLHGECQRLGVTLFHSSIACATWVDAARVRGVVLAGPLGYGLLSAKALVDATGCADVPAAAGAETVAIAAEHVAVQGVGLAGLRPDKPYHNSDHNFSDDTDLLDATAFLVSSKLKNADHVDAGQLVDSRERRQIVGEFSLSPLDFLFERRFPDTICVSASNFDTHGYTIHPLFLVKPPDKVGLRVDVPYRCLLPRGLEGVLVTGLGLSAHRDALPVVRMQPDVQNHGYAAGRAAAMAAAAGCGLRDIDLRALQQHLIEIGNLPERVLDDCDNFPVADALLQQAVAEGWDDFKGLALIFADGSRSRPLLRSAFDACHDQVQRLRYAQILALLGDAHGVADLRSGVAAAAWDEGWNYKGMSQFGLSSSPVDGLIIALGTVDGPAAWAPILAKIAALDDEPAFSHCRALALACERLHARHPDARAALALAGLLRRPGIAGHVQTDIQAVQTALTADGCENGVRNRALRELHLARALALCGDLEGLGEATLAAYATDLRGHFARHARALLTQLQRQEAVLTIG